MNPENSLLEVVVEKLALGGFGVARASGLVLFIPFSAPGDRLEIQITEQKKNFAFAKITKILQPGSSRVSPKCEVFGRCGGCQLQHIAYAEQLKEKDRIVREQLAKVITSETNVLPIIASQDPWHYRNRIQVHFHDKKWGFLAKRSHDFVATKNCPIAESELVSMAGEQAALGQNGRFELRLPKSGSTAATFAQVNTKQNEVLRELILAWAATEKPWPEIWDLYAGSGNFSFPLNQSHKKSALTAVESSPEAVRVAQDRLRAENRSPQHMKFILAPVEAFLKRALLQDQGLVLIDPPRVGCEKMAISSLAHQSFAKLLYLSCNPATLVRDLVSLLQLSPRKLHLTRVQAIDMFPQTDHIETLVEITPFS